MLLRLINSMVLFLLVYPSVIVVHELGHYFFAAKYLRVLVEEVSFGVGRALYAWKRNGTIFVLRLFPFGGNTQMKAEKGCKRRAQRMMFYTGQPAGKRAIVAAGGCMANLLCAGALWCASCIGMTAVFPQKAQVILEYALLTHMLSGMLNLLPFAQMDGNHILSMVMEKRRGGMRR